MRSIKLLFIISALGISSQSWAGHDDVCAIGKKAQMTHIEMARVYKEYTGDTLTVANTDELRAVATCILGTSKRDSNDRVPGEQEEIMLLFSFKDGSVLLEQTKDLDTARFQDESFFFVPTNSYGTQEMDQDKAVSAH